ncbi:MAG: hypothetical protein IM568_14145, partial [Flavobacterium sp.]|nr:hypothetical protein [Flavobacterium sp.]
MLDDNIQTWSQALEKVDWSQVLITMATGVLPISNKYVVAAIAGGGVILQDLKTNGFTSWDNLGVKFVEGFMGSLIGTSLGDLVASKFGTLNNLGRKLVTKFEGIFSYGTICRWLGGGLQQINKSFNHTLGNGQVITITANKVMKGWDPQKIAVIGRSQEERVVAFANKLSNELGIHVHQIKEWPGWNSNLTVEQNKQWIQKLKSEGYTIYDIGTDPRYGDDKGLFYGMEYEEIFGN